MCRKGGNRHYTETPGSEVMLMLETNGRDKPLRVLVADQDRRCRQKVKALLAAESNVDVVGECSRTTELEEALRIHKPDVLFLEPQIPGGNVFDVLASESLGFSPLLVFATSHDQYAVKAFESNAVDFVMKPYDPKRLHAAIERAKSDLASRRPQNGNGGTAEHVRDVKAATEERLMVKAGGRMVFLRFVEMDWIEAAANYVTIHAGSEEYRIRQPISEFEKRVAGHNFSRIHRSTIVNLSEVVAVQPCNSGEYMVRLKCGKELACSRNFNSGIRTLLETFLPEPAVR